ncbi:HEAT repeat domain-containing protein [Candidatus Halobeggiatoa sp. HSG11]|nr:HEAT repeat domain-containing protein [Candidatus Halobeggiatoa sp. HSG11]
MEPYKGLRPYEEQDKDNFFGREAEKQILIDKILTNKLTLLFAASGVGKSSLLQAAVMPQLKDPAGENIDVIYHKEWFANPEADLKQTLVDYFQARGVNDKLDTSLPLPAFLHFCTIFTNEPLVIILDQFEEFFNYQRHDKDFKPFIKQLAEAVLDRNSPTVFVFSMREDFALELNAFKPELPTLLFNNFYRLEKLSRENAKKAIAAPLEPTGFTYESGLLDILLDDLSRREQQDRFGKTADLLDAPPFVEPPHLQIVCMQLWQLAQDHSDKQITIAVYQEQGQATSILKNYFVNQIEQLSHVEKQLASNIFNYLVNKHGTKIAYPLNELTELLRIDEPVLANTLDKLEQIRILRKQSRQQILWYELYHDVFSKIIYDWNKKYKVSQYNEVLLLVKNFQLLQFSRVEKKIVSLVFQNIIIKHGNQEGISVKGLLKLLPLNEHILLAKILYKLEHAKILRKRLWQKIEWYELYHEIFFKTIYEWNETYRTRQPIKKLGIAMGATIFGGTLLFVGYDGWNNANSYYLNLSLKTGITDTIEIYQGKTDSFDFFEQTKYLAETNYSRADIEVDKLFQQKQIEDVEYLNDELIATFPLTERIQAYWENGDIDKVLSLSSAIITDYDNNLSYKIINYLAEFRSVKSIEKLGELLPEKNIDLKMRIIYALGTSQAPVQVITPLLLPFLEDENNSIRQITIEMLGQLGNYEIIKQLIPLLKDSESSIRISVVSALSEIDNSEVIKSLLELLQEPEWDIRQNVIEALGKLGRDEAIKPLVELLKIPELPIRWEILEALEKLDNVKTIKLLLELIKEPSLSFPVHQNIMAALTQLDSDEIFKLSIEFLNSPNLEIRQSSIEALGNLGNTDAVKPLIKLLTDSNSSIRKNTVIALKQLEDITAVKPLIELLNDPNLSVRNSVLGVLSKLGGVEVVIVPTDQCSSN